MSEDTPDEGLELETEETEFDPARARAALEKKNREAANLRARLKELEPLAAKAREADEAAKSQAQKDAEARAAVERERDDARLALLKRDAAESANLPRAWADRLKGSTKEELEADAKALAKDLAPQTPGTARPVADLRSAALPAGDANGKSGFDADAFIRRSAGYPAR